MDDGNTCRCRSPYKCCYWSLPCPTLKSKASSADRAERESLRRRARGLLDYEMCDIKELRSFMTSRGLQKLPKRTSKKVLVRHLQSADDQVTFPRFMDLPSELRVAIYGFQLESLKPLAPYETSQPPITRVSQTIRRKALPIFCRKLHLCAHYVKHSMLHGKKAVPIISASLSNYVKSLTVTTLGQIRAIEISLADRGRQGVRWLINLYPGGANGLMISRETYRPEYRTWSEFEISRAEHHLMPLIEGIVARPRQQKLSTEDFTSFEKAFEAAVTESDGGEHVEEYA